MYDHRHGRGLSCRCANTSGGNTAEQGPRCLYLLTSCSPALRSQVLWVQAHPSQPGWMSHTMGDEAPQGIPWIPTWKYRVGMLLPKKNIFAPNPTEVLSSGCICAHRRISCQHICITWAHICITWAHICLAGSAMGSFGSYRSQRLSCLYCRSHTLSNSTGFRCHKTCGLTHPRSLPPPRM